MEEIFISRPEIAIDDFMVVFFSGALEKLGIDYLQLLMVVIPSTFLAVMLGAFVTNFLGKELKDDPIYQERLAKGQVSESAKFDDDKELPPEAKRSVLILVALV